MYYLAGVVSGVILTRTYEKDKDKYDTWLIISKAVLMGFARTLCRRIKRKFTDPDLMGSSGVLLRGGSKVEWTSDNVSRSARMTTNEIIEKMTHGSGRNTFLLDVADKHDHFWRVWVTGRILYSDPEWPFNEVIVDDREGITEAVIEIGKSGDNDHKTYTLTEHFNAIDGPQNNFGSNTNVPIWVALKVMTPHVDCLRLQEAYVEVSTIHGSVTMNTKETLYELHQALVHMEDEVYAAEDGEDSGYE